MKNATRKNVIKFLQENVFELFSVPEFIFSDNGAQFISKAFTEFLKENGVSHIRTPKYTPPANMSERVNRSILDAVRSYIGENHRDWDTHISSISVALRNTRHQSHNYFPHFIVYGKNHEGHGSQYKLIHLLGSLAGNDLNI